MGGDSTARWLRGASLFASFSASCAFVSPLPNFVPGSSVVECRLPDAPTRSLHLPFSVQTPRTERAHFSPGPLELNRLGSALGQAAAPEQTKTRRLLQILKRDLDDMVRAAL